jgi:hypothetical protein
MPTLGGRAGAVEAAHGAYLTCLSEMERNCEGSPGVRSPRATDGGYRTGDSPEVMLPATALKHTYISTL